MIWVYDIEQFPNAHVVVFRNRDSDEIRRFIIWKDGKDEINDIVAYQDFLRKEVKGMIGYNNVGYDYHLIDFILTVNPSSSVNFLLSNLDGISSQAVSDEGLYIPEWKHRIPQLDLYKIWHFDNVARATSLKSLQFAMRWHNLQDLPYDPGTHLDRKMLEKTAEYCVNDVDSTKAFYFESKDMIYDRKSFEKAFGFSCDNYSSVRIGEKINAITYEKRTGTPYKYFKNKKTFRSLIPAKDCIADFVHFKKWLKVACTVMMLPVLYMQMTVISKKMMFPQCILHV